MKNESLESWLQRLIDENAKKLGAYVHTTTLLYYSDCKEIIAELQARSDKIAELEEQIKTKQ